MGGSTGEIIESTKSRARQYKREKIDEQTRAAQANAGAVTGDAMSSFEMGMEGVGDFVERNTRSLRPQSEDSPETSDTVSANYSKSSSEKSSKTDKKSKTESKGGTGGSKRQFYA
tara:strand:+ start:109 stop:453 length:345 start_codon:yes stop_codon:yes gene_type:complete